MKALNRFRPQSDLLMAGGYLVGAVLNRQAGIVPLLHPTAQDTDLRKTPSNGAGSASRS